jgi:hypothetical protein
MVDGFFAPRTFRNELFRLSRSINGLANSKGSKPSPDEEMAIIERFGRELSPHVMSAKVKLRTIPETYQNNPLMQRLTKILPMRIDDLKATASLLAELATLVPDDVPPLPRPAIGESWANPL